MRQTGLGLAVVVVALLLCSVGCQTDKKPNENSGMSGSSDGGMSLCDTRKGANPDSVCCPNEPCADIKTDSLNCGGCGHVCRSGEVCSNSLCLCRRGGHDDMCAAGAVCCPDGCHQTQSDPKNCG